MLSRLCGKKLDSRGDTIVEVMIVLAVLGLALGISYSTANRSLLNSRQAQENSAASALVQAQVENLWALAPQSAAPSKNIFSSSLSTPFCIRDVNAMNPITVNSLGSSCGFGPNNLYTINIYSCQAYPTDPCNYSGSKTDVFIVRAQWPDVLGQGTDQVTLAYKVHQ